MSTPPGGWTDQRVDEVIGNLLRAGVLTAAVLACVGGVISLARHGREPSDHHHFHGEPPDYRGPVGVVRGALSLSGRGLIQLGLLVLIATPVARVVFSVFAFFKQRDYAYVVVTLIVLAVLLYSLFGQAV